MQSDDELAFVLGHEMSHHIAGHIAKQQQQQVLGALILGGLVAAAGNPYGGPASDQAIQQAMDVGAYVGGRAYSQSYELEADTLGAYITARAGYSPERGADIFGRPALANPGGPAILASHPGSAQRQATVARVAAEIRRQQALGLSPPAPAAPPAEKVRAAAFWGLRSPSASLDTPLTAADGARRLAARRRKTGSTMRDASKQRRNLAMLSVAL